MKKVICILTAFVLMMSVMTGCSDSANTGTNTEDIKKISYALSQEPETLDPTLNVYSRSSIVLQNLFRGLYKRDKDGILVPALAESYTVSDDGLVYTFKLKDGLKWSDGTKLTANDFEYSWKRVLNPEVASQASYEMFYIKNGEKYNKGEVNVDEVGIKATDENTLEVILENPTAYFVDLTAASSFFPVKKEFVEASTPWTKSPSTYACTGPFMLKEIKPQEKYILVKNPNYVDAQNVKLDQLDIVFIESPEAQLVAYKNNEIQVSDGISSQALQEYKDLPDYKVSPRIGTYYLDINCSIKPFDDPRVRKALAMAIDRKVIVENILQASYKPAYAFVPYGIPYALDPTKDFRDVGGDLFNQDIEEAKKLLTEAGFPNGEGFPVLDYKTLNSASDLDIAQALQSMWQKNLGIKVEITTYESKVYWDELHNGTYNVCRDGWTGDYPDPMTNLAILHIDESDDDTRWSGAKAEEFSSYLDSNKKTIDQDVRMKNFLDAESVLMDDMPVIPVYFMSSTYVVKENITGVIKNFIGHTIFEYADVVQ